MNSIHTDRQKDEILRSELELDRASHLSVWKDICENLLPMRPRFSVSENGRGERKNQKIIDSTPTQALGALRSGLMSGVTSPARPWFRLTTPDPDLAEQEDVKTWLYNTTVRMHDMFAKSNLYNQLPIVYGDLGSVGNSALFIEEDFDEVMRFYSFPVGSYAFATDAKGRVNKFHREFQMSVSQIVEKFGYNEETNKITWDNISISVRNLWEQDQKQKMIEVCHVIRPNDNFNPRRLESKFKKFVSRYYEKGMSGAAGMNTPEGNKYLSQSGYEYFPLLGPRWEINGEDTYSVSYPGINALGDIRQLQLGERRIAQAVDKMVNPPMVGPTSLRNQKTTILPADITYVDEREGQKGFRPAHEINFRVDLMEGKQEQVRQRIKRTFYEDLFLMLANSDRRQITAREIEERHEEKLLALGPVLEQLNQDLLDPLIDIAFMMMLRQGKIEEPPEALQGADLRVEYVSIMAQAQKLVGIGSVERFAGFVGQIASMDPSVLMKVNTSEMVDIYGDLVSVPPGIIRSEDEVAAMQQQQQQAAAQQQQAEAISQGATAAKDLAQADLSTDNALSRVLGL